MKKSTLTVHLPGSGPGLRYSRLRMTEEIARHTPAVVILKAHHRCVEITSEIFFELVAASGISLRDIPWEITVPRSGWIILVPRTSVRRYTSKRAA